MKQELFEQCDPSAFGPLLENTENLLFDTSVSYYSTEKLYLERAKGALDLLFLKDFTEYQQAIKMHSNYLVGFIRACGGGHRAWAKAPHSCTPSDQIMFLRRYDGERESYECECFCVAERFLHGLKKRYDLSVLYAAALDGLPTELYFVRRRYEAWAQSESAASREYWHMAYEILKIGQTIEIDRLIAFYKENATISDDTAHTAAEWNEPVDILYMPAPESPTQDRQKGEAQ